MSVTGLKPILVVYQIETTKGLALTMHRICFHITSWSFRGTIINSDFYRPFTSEETTVDLPSWPSLRRRQVEIVRQAVDCIASRRRYSHSAEFISRKSWRHLSKIVHESHDAPFCCWERRDAESCCARGMLYLQVQLLFMRRRQGSLFQDLVNDMSSIVTATPTFLVTLSHNYFFTILKRSLRAVTSKTTRPSSYADCTRFLNMWFCRNIIIITMIMISSWGFGLQQ